VRVILFYFFGEFWQPSNNKKKVGESDKGIFDIKKQIAIS
jgi:hypothetical protein